jgi:GxxExxY protein
MQVKYKNRVVGDYVADLIVEGVVIIELKSVDIIAKAYEAQLLNYLKATGIRVGLILNFGTPRLGIRRMV